MQFNGGKCLALHISRKDTSCGSERTYTLNGQQLESAPPITDFGITVSNDMSWARHK